MRSMLKSLIKAPSPVRDGDPVLVLLHGGKTAKDHGPWGRGQNRGARVGATRIEREDLRGDAGLDKSGDHAVGRPRLLRTRFQYQPQLKRDGR